MEVDGGLRWRNELFGGAEGAAVYAEPSLRCFGRGGGGVVEDPGLAAVREPDVR